MTNSLPPLPETPVFDALSRSDKKALIAYVEDKFRAQGNRPAPVEVSAKADTQYYTPEEYIGHISHYIERLASGATTGGPMLQDAIREGNSLVANRDRIKKSNDGTEKYLGLA